MTKSDELALGCEQEPAPQLEDMFLATLREMGSTKQAHDISSVDGHELLRIAKSTILPLLSDQTVALRYDSPRQWAAFNNEPYDSVFELVLKVGEFAAYDAEVLNAPTKLPWPSPSQQAWRWLKEALATEAIKVSEERGYLGPLHEEVNAALQAGLRLIEWLMRSSAAASFSSERIVEDPVGGKTAGGESDKTAKGGSQKMATNASVEDRALAVLVLHQDWTNQQIAAEVGTHPKYLSSKDCSKFKAARAAIRASSIPSGSKGKDGTIEAIGNDLDFDAMDSRMNSQR